MKIDHFWHILRTSLGYHSPRRFRFLLENLPGWATCKYYIQLAAVIFRESLTARKGSYDDKAWGRGSLRVIRIVESAGGRFQLSGLASITGQQGSRVYVANHMSLVDTLVLPCILLAFNPVSFVVKEGLLHYPFLGWIIRASHPIAVTRKSPREDLRTVMTQGEALLSGGTSVIIFPQATRSETFDPASFNSLGVKLARRAGVPVVPVALKTDFQKNGKILKDFGPINPRKTLYLKVGKPMAGQGGGQVTHQKVVEFISENLRAWGATVTSGV
jgi:1-acyl-sn-glycerol-3-phosphate acyltransferase